LVFYQSKPKKDDSMVQMTAVYTGEKHCELRHGPSSSLIETDAPRDNQGRGERFSPTDLVGAALASCVLTTMAIMAEKEGLIIKGASARVQKEMNSDPRRIARLPLEVTMPSGISSENRTRLEAAAKNCPVARSLSKDVELPMTFIYLD
jgi:putative redox protein